MLQKKQTLFISSKLFKTKSDILVGQGQNFDQFLFSFLLASARSRDNDIIFLTKSEIIYYEKI